MISSKLFFGIKVTSDSPNDPNNFIYGLAEVVEELNFLLGTIKIK